MIRTFSDFGMQTIVLSVQKNVLRQLFVFSICLCREKKLRWEPTFSRYCKRTTCELCSRRLPVIVHEWYYECLEGRQLCSIAEPGNGAETCSLMSGLQRISKRGDLSLSLSSTLLVVRLVHWITLLPRSPRVASSNPAESQVFAFS